MQTAPAPHNNSDGSSLPRGTASRSRLPTIVTTTGKKPITSEVIAIPPVCTAVDSRT
jgi:hypothetical protein